MQTLFGTSGGMQSSAGVRNGPPAGPLQTCNFSQVLTCVQIPPPDVEFAPLPSTLTLVVRVKQVGDSVTFPLQPMQCNDSLAHALPRLRFVSHPEVIMCHWWSPSTKDTRYDMSSFGNFPHYRRVTMKSKSEIDFLMDVLDITSREKEQYNFDTCKFLFKT